MDLVVLVGACIIFVMMLTMLCCLFKMRADQKRIKKEQAKREELLSQQLEEIREQKRTVKYSFHK